MGALVIRCPVDVVPGFMVPASRRCFAMCLRGGGNVWVRTVLSVAFFPKVCLVVRAVYESSMSPLPAMLPAFRRNGLVCSGR